MTARWLAIPDTSALKLAGSRRIAATYGTRSTCPPSCPFVGLCYAETGPGGSTPFRKAETLGLDDAATALDRIRFGAPHRAAVRHFVSGNPTPEYVTAANALHAARPDLRDAWGYMHGALDGAAGVTPDDARGWLLRVSVETAEQVAEVLARGWQPVVTSPAGSTLAGPRIGGRRVVPCPNQSTGGRVKCSDCNLCRRDDATAPVVEFVWHGAYRSPASAAILTARTLGRAA